MSSFIDEAKITVEAGNGGDGAVSFRHEKYIPRGGPDGGDGGAGGSIALEADTNLNTLYQFRYQKRFQAKSGERGGKSNRHGKNADDIVLPVPIGTLVKVVQDDGTTVPIADLAQPGQRLLVAKGGRGGKGNARFATATNQAPRMAIPGAPGQKVVLDLELKLLADIGLVGLPNAGKSTLLSLFTKAQPKIANYPFTTVEPNLGVAEYQGQEIVIADIPGLIEGASLGKGLGDQFLKHIERTRCILHLVSLNEEGDAWQQYQLILDELEAFSPELLQKRQLLVFTKVDLISEDRVLEVLGQAKQRQIPAIAISSVTHQGLSELLGRLAQVIQEYNVHEREVGEGKAVEVKTYTLANLPHKFVKKNSL